MPPLATPTGRLVFLPTRLSRAEFISRMSGLLGANQRLLYVPNGTDTTTSVESSTVGRTITWDATIAARASALGNGYGQSFNGTTQYGSMPDADDMSFGDGSTDQAFSCLALANVTDTAAGRDILLKWSGGATLREWAFILTASDTLRLDLFDESTDGAPNRASDAAITQGSWCLFGATYDGRGGATAADGITLYANGAVIASTATNSGTYTAMENLTIAPAIGARNAGTAGFYAGSLAMVALTQKSPTASEHAQMRSLCRRFFGLPL